MSDKRGPGEQLGMLIQFIYANSAYGSGDALHDLDEITRAVEDAFGKDKCQSWRDIRGVYWGVRPNFTERAEPE